MRQLPKPAWAIVANIAKRIVIAIGLVFIDIVGAIVAGVGDAITVGVIQIVVS